MNWVKEEEEGEEKLVTHPPYGEMKEGRNEWKKERKEENDFLPVEQFTQQQDSERKEGSRRKLYDKEENGEGE